MSNKKREPGYYWVKTEETNRWEMSNYFHNGIQLLFFPIGKDFGFPESELFKINEERIRNPDEPNQLKERIEELETEMIDLKDEISHQA